jgi:hypothetical protein
MQNQDRSDRLFSKIWGTWTAKIAAGTYGQLVEGWAKKRIQKMNPPLTGWIPSTMKMRRGHVQWVNDDEQYELIALLALEALSDDQFQKRKKSHILLAADYLGPFWAENLDRKFVFTAELWAWDNATKKNVPWEHAGDEIFENKYQNPFFDWIGAQMKGELFGMLAPAWGWHTEVSITPKADLDRLKSCLELSYQDAMIAHRGIGVVGELFVSAMVAIGIDYDPSNHTIQIKFPQSTALLRKLENGDPPMEGEFPIIGITAETIISDMKRLKAALLLYDKVQKSDVEQYFTFIDCIIAKFDTEHDPRKWEEAWATALEITKKYRNGLIKDAKNRLSTNKEGLKLRLKELKSDHSFAVHTVLNNSAIAIGLIYGDGDMFQTMHRASEPGLDVDCNAGNAAAILGAYLGQELIPVYNWRFVRGEVLSPLRNWKGSSIKQLAERTFVQTQRFMKL